jgi:hypothetical protein
MLGEDLIFWLCLGL